MRLNSRPFHSAIPSRNPTRLWTIMFSFIPLILSLLCPSIGVNGMTDDQVFDLRHDTVDLFYHGYNNYMRYAFPEDELKPISCKPQTRNRDNPADIGLNDVLGNYTLTLIDSLSSLAILASGPQDKLAKKQKKKDERDSFRDFQDGVKSLVQLYGHGTEEKPCGTRACGFDLDSKVQVFETNIRGVGGLLSAHLFAIGELPISGYMPVRKEGKNPGIKWKNGFTYNNQLLWLAYDLAERLLPAFDTNTGIPYPRVNLRTGIPFYRESEFGVCRLDGSNTDPREVTETCAAGAGSLVLEFATLTRLTGDVRFEHLAKNAFWAIWNRRSPIGLIGNGIDAELGHWVQPALSGIGAGIDSFFEYSLKSAILLSNIPCNPDNSSLACPDEFLQVWQDAHAGVKRHIYRTKRQEKHPYYAQVDLQSGALRYSWIDNLSAYWPGLLVLAGKIEEAIESHLLFSALWTRYSALPERWQTPNGYIDPHFKHWAGRPEFIESTFHLYQATKDPYYLHVGEMAIRDIRRRCWTKCGWADLGNVISGEQRDRMESFFLGETAKYLYLLFTEDHPLNKLDKPVVFTTEGHPLIIPDKHRGFQSGLGTRSGLRRSERSIRSSPVCPAPPPALPLTVSNVAARGDLFHASSMAQLHLVPVHPARPSPLIEKSNKSPGISFSDVRSPTNYTFYPWTLPRSLVPTDGVSSLIVNPIVSTLTFPNLAGASAGDGSEKGLVPLGALQKVMEGILVNSLSNIRLNMVQEPRSILLPDGNGVLIEQILQDEFRIHGIANWALGKEEKVLLSTEALKGVSPSDPHFTKIKDLEMLDLILDIPSKTAATTVTTEADPPQDNRSIEGIWNDYLESMLSSLLPDSASEKIKSLRASFPTPHPNQKLAKKDKAVITRLYIPAVLPTGIGSAPLPPSIEGDENDIIDPPLGSLPYTTIFFLEDDLCNLRLPSSIPKNYQILMIFRGGCSFSEKLENIPAFVPEEKALKLVVVVSRGESFQQGGEDGGEGVRSGGLIRPLLDHIQRTPTGLDRRNLISMVMIDASRPLHPTSSSGAEKEKEKDVVELLRRAATTRGKVDGEMGSVVEEDGGAERKEGTRRGGGGGGGSRIGVKRRYWFESQGVRIGNLELV